MDINREKLVKCRKECRCESCGRVIKKDTSKVHHEGDEDEDFWTVYLCLACDKIMELTLKHKDYSDWGDGIPFNEILETAESYDGTVYLDGECGKKNRRYRWCENDELIFEEAK